MRTALAAALGCPTCRAHVDPESLECTGCGDRFRRVDGTPALLPPGHAMLEGGHRAGTLRHSVPKWRRRPEARVWTRASKAAIARAVADAGGEDPDRLIVVLGAGYERVFRAVLDGRPAVAHIGLPHMGGVDVFGDALHFPLVDSTVDLVMSSSVVEHISDPELGVEEMARVVRPGGLVYAEIPFLRGYHMAPHDYQRYTIAGIERLFSRHGFELVDKGVCSGPFTALALFMSDMARAFGRGPLGRWVVWLLLRLLHPVKHLDRLVEGRAAAATCACNFYYLGRRVSPA